MPDMENGRQNRLWNYRGITLLSHVGNLYGGIIENRLRTHVESIIGEWQHGRRPGKSTIDLIFTLKMIPEKSWEWGRDKFALFIDMEKAFDRINREALWETISDEYYSILPKVVRIIKNIYLVSSCKLRNPG